MDCRLVVVRSATRDKYRTAFPQCVCNEWHIDMPSVTVAKAYNYLLNISRSVWRLCVHLSRQIPLTRVYECNGDEESCKN